LGDLRANNVRRVVCQFEVRSTSNQDKEEVLLYELHFKNPLDPSQSSSKENTQSFFLKGSISIKYTDDESKIEKFLDPEVKLRVCIQESAELDRSLVQLIDSRKRDEAMAVQEKQIQLLKSVLHLDIAGEFKIAKEIKKAEESLEKMKKEGLSKNVRKEVDHRGYRKKRSSECYDSLYLDD